MLDDDTITPHDDLVCLVCGDPCEPPADLDPLEEDVICETCSDDLGGAVSALDEADRKKIQKRLDKWLARNPGAMMQ